MFQIRFDPRDIWIGLHLNKTYERISQPDGDYTQYYIELYICIIPMLPLIFSIKTGKSFKAQYNVP